MKKYKISNTEQCGEIGGNKIFICNRFLEIWGNRIGREKGPVCRIFWKRRGVGGEGLLEGRGCWRAEQKFHQVFRYLY